VAAEPGPEPPIPSDDLPAIAASDALDDALPAPSADVVLAVVLPFRDDAGRSADRVPACLRQDVGQVAALPALPLAMPDVKTAAALYTPDAVPSGA
jgi:hypothetical protein